MVNKVKALTAFAEGGMYGLSDTRGSEHALIAPPIVRPPELGCSVSQLALAWVAVNPNTSTVILGASKPEQVLDNLKALDVIPKLTPEVLEKIEAILQTKPSPVVRVAARRGCLECVVLTLMIHSIRSRLMDVLRWTSMADSEGDGVGEGKSEKDM